MMKKTFKIEIDLPLEAGQFLQIKTINKDVLVCQVVKLKSLKQETKRTTLCGPNWKQKPPKTKG